MSASFSPLWKFKAGLRHLPCLVIHLSAHTSYFPQLAATPSCFPCLENWQLCSFILLVATSPHPSPPSPPCINSFLCFNLSLSIWPYFLTSCLAYIPAACHVFPLSINLFLCADIFSFPCFPFNPPPTLSLSLNFAFDGLFYCHSSFKPICHFLNPCYLCFQSAQNCNIRNQTINHGKPALTMLFSTFDSGKSSGKSSDLFFGSIT